MAFFVFVMILALSAVSADVNVSNYVYWKKADISAWNQYFPSRAFQEEWITNSYAISTVWNVDMNLNESLRKVVFYQAQELATAQLMMEGTSAQGCVQGISNFIDKAIKEEISTYKDCSADVQSRLQRASNDWIKIQNNYQSVYQRTLSGMDTCAKAYPNKDSLNRLKNCVEAWNRKYFTVANATKGYNALVSPSMKIFSTVAECAQTAAQNLVDKGWQLLQKLGYCAKLSENIDAQEYLEQVTVGFSQYLTKNDLTAQIYQAQLLNTQQVRPVEETMLFYYDLQKKALENYVIKSKDLDWYYSRVAQNLSAFFDVINEISVQYPSNTGCVFNANLGLNAVASAGAELALACDQNIVNDTIYLLDKVNNRFQQGNQMLPYSGNVAILQCLSRGYFFAEDTITGCFNVTASLFSVEYSEALDSVVKDVTTLLGYQNNFFANSSLPCGDSILRRAYWEARQVLYDLGRCLYINSDNEYSGTYTIGTNTTVQERRSWKKIIRDAAKNIAIGYIINSIG